MTTQKTHSQALKINSDPSNCQSSLVIKAKNIVYFFSIKLTLKLMY